MRKPIRAMGLGISAVLLAAACSSASSGSGTSPHAATSPKAGGSLTVLEWAGYAGAWPGLDPATNTNGAADQSQMTSIFGQLFELGAHGAIIDDLATGYAFSNGNKTLTLTLRPGVTFTDGTPFNAQAVAWNFQRDLKSTCSCRPTYPVTTVTATGPDTVRINLAIPDGALIDQLFDSTPDWVASPTAYAKMGARQFALTPVGAGPFEVVSDTLSAKLVLKKNPGYWQPGRPYLDTLTFQTVGGDQAGYEAMLANEGQVYEDMSTPSLLGQAAQHFDVQNQLGTSPYDLQLNTLAPPFSNKLAREAIYYATNFAPILQHVFNSLYPATQGFTGPGGICYEPDVPGYPQYDLAKAKALVSQLGGLTVNLGTIAGPVVAQDTIEALQTQWQAAGIKVTLATYQLTPLIAQFTSGKWQAMVQTAGAYDPAQGVGVGFRFSSMSPFSGVHDPHLDGLLNQATATTDMTQRCSLYNQAAAYIAQNFYGPFYFAFAPANLSAKDVNGPGLTSPLPSIAVTPTIPWEDVYLSS